MGKLQVAGDVVMTGTIAEVIMRANDGWIPVEAGLPLVSEVVAVTCQPKNGPRNWNRAWVDNGGNWHGSGTMSNVIAWKPIKPWMG